MSKLKAAITGVGGYVPDFVLSNELLETMVDTTDEWIQTRTGIKERRILKGDFMGTSVLAAGAIQNLLDKTNTDPDSVELVICATVTADRTFPDTATIACHKVGLKNAFGFDLSAACSGFLFALNTGASYIQSGMYKKVIVVGADKMSSIVDYTDRSTCVIFGDGGGAVLLEPSKDDDGYHSSILKADGAGEEYLKMPAGGSRKPPSIETVKNKEHFIFQNGRPVFKAAVTAMSTVVKELMEKEKLSKDDVNWLVPHQANLRIIKTVSEMMDFPLEKVMITIQKYGNTTAATIPLSLNDYESQLKKGDKLILTAFGGGFTWGASHLTWAY